MGGPGASGAQDSSSLIDEPQSASELRLRPQPMAAALVSDQTLTLASEGTDSLCLTGPNSESAYILPSSGGSGIRDNGH